MNKLITVNLRLLFSYTKRKMRAINLRLALLPLVVSGARVQLPIESPTSSLSFIDRSIFAHSPPRDAAVLAAQPVLHVYDDFSDDIPYQGIAYFAHINGTNCFSPANDASFDIAIVGAPFDLGVTYRPGARFGPAGTRMGSRRLSPSMAYSMDHLRNPFKDWAAVVDCGDIGNSPFDKLQAIHELEAGWTAIAKRPAKNVEKGDVPRIISIGGDHTISRCIREISQHVRLRLTDDDVGLPAVRALSKTWGRVSVLHFDSHLDTWDPRQLGGGVTKYSEISHGSMFHILHEEGLLAKKNMHLGSRSKLFDQQYDLDNDARCGFSYIRAREMDIIGIEKIISRIVETVQDQYVYLSIDIDVMDPGESPSTP